MVSPLPGKYDKYTFRGPCPCTGVLLRVRVANRLGHVLFNLHQAEQAIVKGANDKQEQWEVQSCRRLVLTTW